MTTPAQRRAVTRHRTRRAREGLARVEVQVPTAHAALVRRVASTLRADPSVAERLSKAIDQPKPIAPMRTLGAFFDDLPDVSDPAFDDVFERGRDRSLPDDVDL